MAELEFGFAFDPTFRGLLLGLGVTPSRCGVTVDADGFAVRFGPWSLTTTHDNIAAVSITGPHRWWRAIGPRLSFQDGGVTFGTNVERTVFVELHRRVPGLEPTGTLLHPNVTLSVEDCDGLVRALQPD